VDRRVAPGQKRLSVHGPYEAVDDGIAYGRTTT